MAHAGPSRAPPPFMNTTTAIVLTAIALADLGRASAAKRPAFRGNIEEMTRKNTDFRRTIHTGPHIQVVAMSLAVGENIGEEVHRVDQCFVFVEGTGESVLNGQAAPIVEGEMLCVPAGMRHNIRNTGTGPLKLFTLYAPPAHRRGRCTTRRPTRNGLNESSSSVNASLVTLLTLPRRRTDLRTGQRVNVYLARPPKCTLTVLGALSCQPR